MTTEDREIALNSAILRLQASQGDFHESFQKQFAQLKADLLEKLDDKMKIYAVQLGHLDEKFDNEVSRGDELFKRGLKELERHEEEDRARIDAVVATQNRFESRLEEHETMIKDNERLIKELQAAPDKKTAQAVQETKKTFKDTMISWGVPALIITLFTAFLTWVKGVPTP